MTRKLAAVVMGIVFCAAPVLAQERSVLAHLTRPMVDVRNAEALEREAGRLRDVPDRYREGARLYERAAGLRSEADPQAVRSLVLASRLYHAAGAADQARLVLKQAASRALAGGDVIAAAHAYVDAAWLAAQEEDDADALAMSMRALDLTSSPLLRVSEREAILARLGQSAGK